MTTNNILKASLNDIIFDGRNKEYGAYELRNSYDSRIGKALLTTGILIGLAIGASAIAGSGKKHETVYRVGPQISLTQVKTDKPIEKLPEPEKPKVEKTVEVKMEKFTSFKVVENPSTPPPSQTDLNNAAIGADKTDGINDNGVVPVKTDDIPASGNGIVDIPVPAAPTEPFTEVAIQAQYIGNWSAFLLKNLNGNVPLDNGAAAGRYTVMIQFVVDVDGSVSNIVPLTSVGYGMEEEAIRVLKKAKGWEPAIQNGLKVKAYRKQPITFEVLDES
ncbi:MAG TPA: TonB family protein [Chitinophagaceae bacterium]|jgi:protein TonB|nr:TonB family protein [Chitinophagaceae bacterium]HMU59392.1 TonB family protein [Chitinophagaceae bacterium]